MSTDGPGAWSIHMYKHNGGQPGWFVVDHVHLTEWPEKGDIIEVDKDRMQVTWINYRNRGLGVVMVP